MVKTYGKLVVKSRRCLELENNLRCLEDIYTGKLKLDGLSKIRLAKNLCCQFQNIWDRGNYVGFIDGKNIIFSPLLLAIFIEVCNFVASFIIEL